MFFNIFHSKTTFFIFVKLKIQKNIKKSNNFDHFLKNAYINLKIFVFL
ncbi:hypothetical protein M8044_000057 [Columbia Basin potato purple top phytoplasma]|uniref:Uncharacterized protein n=1 Tax=Columbia Basin potato purple top phytoplasma TaxID=307134 RepID=A0ABT5L8E0_9MOLU|nr:hypothetical protein [Columbia Basin potato purple top phytoplasma]